MDPEEEKEQKKQYDKERQQQSRATKANKKKELMSKQNFLVVVDNYHQPPSVLDSQSTTPVTISWNGSATHGLIKCIYQQFNEKQLIQVGFTATADSVTVTKICEHNRDCHDLLRRLTRITVRIRR